MRHDDGQLQAHGMLLQTRLPAHKCFNMTCATEGCKARLGWCDTALCNLAHAAAIGVGKAMPWLILNRRAHYYRTDLIYPKHFMFLTTMITWLGRCFSDHLRLMASRQRLAASRFK